MRWCTYTGNLSNNPNVGLQVDNRIHGLPGQHSLIKLIASPDELQRAHDLALTNPLEIVDVEEVTMLAPIPVPPSIRDFMAFEEHVVTSTHALNLEVHPNWYKIPVFYFSNPAAVKGPNELVAIPPETSAFDFELEIAAVIGLNGGDIQAQDAERHIAGYTVLCDWSSRDLQEQEMKLNLGPAKGKDSATSFGPWLVTPDELESLRKGNAYDMTMTAYVNGAKYSEGNFSAIYWSFPQLIEYASRGTELRTGDIIGSGTVGTGCILELARTSGSERFPWLKVSDVVRLEVDRLGAIETTIQ
jgi:2-keto-4-pentenoate hydratase/2-oxohepta-3-ene-1,7-dioic acid hydratase in catechol pathway